MLSNRSPNKKKYLKGAGGRPKHNFPCCPWQAPIKHLNEQNEKWNTQKATPLSLYSQCKQYLFDMPCIILIVLCSLRPKRFRHWSIWILTNQSRIYYI